LLIKLEYKRNCDTVTPLYITLSFANEKKPNRPTDRDAFEAGLSRQIPKQLAHLRVVVGEIFNASPPAYKI